MKYNECKVIANIKRGDKPLVSKVPIDDFTNAIKIILIMILMVQVNFILMSYQKN